MKRPTLFQIALYLPVLLLVLAAFTLPVFISRIFGSDAPAIAAVFAFLILSLVYLFRNFRLFLTADLYCATVRGWQRDRLVYRCRGGRASERRILARCRRFGRKCKADTAKIKPELFRHSHLFQTIVDYSCSERFVMVIRTERLDEQTYGSIIGDAKAVLSEQFRLLDKADKKDVHPALFAVVIILAEDIDEPVKALVREPVEMERGALLPVAALCDRGEFYYYGFLEPHIQGMSRRSERNYAVSLAGRLLFGGRLPLENTDERPPAIPLENLEIDLEQSVSEFKRAMRAEWRKEKKESKEEAERVFGELKDGEARMTEEGIYVRLGDRLAICYHMPDADNEKCLWLMKNDRWEYGGKGRISRQEAESIRRILERYLTENGYTFNFV